MKIVFVLLFLRSIFLSAQNSDLDFEKYFMNETLRIDLYHTGDAKEEILTLDTCYIQGPWPGSIRHLIDPFEYGRYQVKVYDKTSQALIYKKGFDTYFGEYKTTFPAGKGMKRTYHESVRIPLPKGKIILSIESRDRQNALAPIFNQEIDPASSIILRRAPLSSVKTFPVVENGPSQKKVDLAFVGDGYSAAEEDKFRKDLQRMVDVFFLAEPYASHKSDFNVYGVWKPSEESGCEEPANKVYRNTSVHATFDSLGLSRYVLTEANRELRDIAGQVPYDSLIIMVNHKRYGGGGIYGLYCVFTVDSPLCNYLLLHEFGHSFVGLGDEYYTSDVAYNEFYPAGIEPLEPNLTALLDAKNLKWKAFQTPDLPIPTSWDKEKYEMLGPIYQKKMIEMEKSIAEAKQKGKPESLITRLQKKREELAKERRQALEDFFAKHPQRENVGAFEGAGYAAKGLFRPMVNCIMFSNNTTQFCRVCSVAVERMIKSHTE